MNCEEDHTDYSRFLAIKSISTFAFCSFTSLIWLCILIRACTRTKLQFVMLIATLMLISQLAFVLATIMENYSLK
jgi:hypothetical protein